MRGLYAIQARAYAHIGDISSAQHAIRLSGEAGRDRVDELHDAVGGEFGFTAERLAMSNSTTALIIGDSGQAEAAARQALTLHGQRPRDAQSAHVLGSSAAPTWGTAYLINTTTGRYRSTVVLAFD
ncbi:hypothetical protein [Streptomyces davaonensis]|uniref:hypothetical protein n=1 Tax=Streptomyces davaonensis TaxID=348043 RepID=UPI00034B9FBC|nr:hypothetical protein [Streptomyces davaonensis]